jgi:hypothetical protein
MMWKIWLHRPALVLTVSALLTSAAPVMARGPAGSGYDYGYQGQPYGNAAPHDFAWCEQHYRSFNKATGTFLGYDGRQHTCPDRGAPAADQQSAPGYGQPSDNSYGFPPAYSYGYYGRGR